MNVNTSDRGKRRYLPAAAVLTLAVLFVAGSMRDAAAEIAVVAHYRLPRNTELVAGTVAPDVWVDASGNGHDLRRMGHPALSSDAQTRGDNQESSSVVFDGVDDRYDATPPLLMQTDNFGIEVWVKLRSDDMSSVVLNGHGAANGYSIMCQNGKWAFLCGGVDFGRSDCDVALDTWQHVAIVRDSGVSKLYVNRRACYQTKTKPNPPEGIFCIGGGSSPSDTMDGAVGEVRVFTFEPGQFQPESDLLLDRASAEKAETARLSFKRIKQENAAAYINTWLVAGPFARDSVSEQAIGEPVQGDSIAGRKWLVFDDRLFSRNYDDYQDLRSFFKIKRNESTADKEVWAHVYVFSPSARKAQFRIGADNEFLAWVNGKLVTESREGTPDRDMVRAPVKFVKGWNRLLLGVANRSPGRLGFYARVCTEAGERIDGLVFSPNGGCGPLKVTTQAVEGGGTNVLPIAWRQWAYVGMEPLGVADRSRFPKLKRRAHASPFVLTAQGGTPPYRWTVEEGDLPPGLSVNADGAIQGAPGANARLGRYSINVSVLDNVGQTSRKTLEMEVRERPNRWFEEARLVALIHAPEHTPKNGFDDLARLMRRQGYKAGFVISYNNGRYLYRWPSQYEPDNPVGDLITPYKNALEAEGLKFGMYMGNLDGPNHGGLNGVIRMVEEAIDRFDPVLLWFDWAGWQGTSLDALFSMIKSKNPDILVLVNQLQARPRRLGNGDWDLVCYEGWGAWGGGMWDAWPHAVAWPKKHTVESWRLLTDPGFEYSRDVTSDWAKYLRVQISLIGEGFVANIDHSPTIVRRTGDLTDRLKDLGQSHIMQAHMKMADWASPRGIPALHESYTNVNPGPIQNAPWGYSTVNLKGDVIYLHVLRNPRGKTGMPATGSLTVGPIRSRVKAVCWMNKNAPLSFEQIDERVTIRLAGVTADQVDTILKIELKPTR